VSKTPAAVFGAVEGIVDEAVLRRLIEDAGGQPTVIHITNGKQNLRRRIRAYNHAANYYPWVVLVDLDHEANCGAALRSSWLPTPSKLMFFRVAVREVESWLLADRVTMAHFLGLPVVKLPRTPDSLDDPKRTVVDLSRHSRRREIREDMVPRPGAGRSEGPAYSSRLIEFAQTVWRPSIAAEHSDSLRRCCSRLRAALGGE
jgi:hypothetical protein